MSTPIHDMPEITQNQASKYITHNSSLRHMDAKMMCVIQDKDLVTSPSVSTGDDGKVWIIAGTGGDWSGFSIDDLAHWYDGSWYNYVPVEGWICYVNDENSIYYYDGADWQVFVGSLNPEFESAKIGDVSGGDYSEFESDGTLEFLGDATVWDDVRITPGAFNFSGTSDPTLSDWQPGLSGATFKVYEFTNNDQVFFTVQIPHSYKEGSDLKPHVHWTPRTRGNEENGNTVAWKLDYSLANVGDIFPSSSTVDLTDTCTGTDDKHEISPQGTIDGSGISISSVLECRLYRDTGDTWVTNTAGNRPALLEFDIHFEIDTVGSRQILSK